MSEPATQVEFPGDEAQLLSIFQAASEDNTAVEGDEVPVQIEGAAGGQTTQLVLQSQTIELNGEQVMVQQGQDPETGEMLLFFQDEQGQHIALPSNVLSSGLVQMAGEGGEMIPISVSQSDGDNSNILQNDPDAVRSDLVAVSLDSLAQIAEGSVAELVATNNIPPSTSIAPTNVVQSVDTPKMSASLEAVVSSNVQLETEDPKITLTCDASGTNGNEDSGNVDSSIAVPVSLTKDPEALETQGDSDQTAFIHVDGNGNNAELEALVANAMAQSGGEGNFVIMTGEDGNQTEIHLSDVLNDAGGQTYLIETAEGLVACTAPLPDNNQLQLDSAAESEILAAAEAQGGLIEGQVIHATGASGQTIAYTISSSNGNYELTPMGNVNPPPAKAVTKSRAKPKPKTSIAAAVVRK